MFIFLLLVFSYGGIKIKYYLCFVWNKKIQKNLQALFHIHSQIWSTHLLYYLFQTNNNYWLEVAAEKINNSFSWNNLFLNKELLFILCKSIQKQQLIERNSTLKENSHDWSYLFSYSALSAVMSSVPWSNWTVYTIWSSFSSRGKILMMFFMCLDNYINIW